MKNCKSEKIIIFFSLILIFFVLISCSSSKSEKISYGIHIQPIFQGYCLVGGCHVSNNTLDLTDYDALFSGQNASGRAAVVPYNPDQSLLYEKLIDPPPFGDLMPISPPAPKSPLPEQYIRKIEDWINQGAERN